MYDAVRHSKLCNASVKVEQDSQEQLSRSGSEISAVLLSLFLMVFSHHTLGLLARFGE